MGGNKKRKLHLVKPTGSLVRPSTSLPTQYNFDVGPSSAAPPAIHPNTSRQQPTVKDYPPPQRLFQTANTGGSRGSPSSATPPLQMTPAQQPSATTANTQSDPPTPTGGRNLQSPHSRQSPHSSHAQNSIRGDEEEEEDDDVLGPADTIYEPNLSEDHLAALNNLLAQKDQRKHLVVLDPDLAPGTTW